ncbi:MAG: Glu-tRNA(Gln) amidotransferase GatDE subunit E, partial [Nitrososphaerales archaeon]
PETDIPPFPISEELIKRLSLQIPKPWQEQVEEFKLKYGLSDKLALQIYDSEYIDIFNELVSTTKVAPSFIATVLLETLVNISRSGLDISRINDSILRCLFKALDEGRISKEAVQEILEIIAKGEVNDVDSAIKKLKLFVISDEELEDIINKIIQENLNLVKERGENSFNVLMGKVMKIVRGKVDGKKVSTLLKEKIKEVSTLCK